MLADNKITRQIESYIEYKQSLGYKLRIESQELRRFARYTRQIEHSGAITVDLAMQWASFDNSLSRWYMARRLETVHTFAKYAASIDPQAQVPPTGVFGKCHGRVAPYIYEEKEILRLMRESANLFSPDGIRRLTVSTALGLLWATGIRRPPRLYDIRHSFACHTILRWLENGEDVNQKIYLLSVYMGHVKPADTYWYPTSTPELLASACERFECRCGKELWPCV